MTKLLKGLYHAFSHYRLLFSWLVIALPLGLLAVLTQPLKFSRRHWGTGSHKNYFIRLIVWFLSRAFPIFVTM